MATLDNSAWGGTPGTSLSDLTYLQNNPSPRLVPGAVGHTPGVTSVLQGSAAQNYQNSEFQPSAEDFAAARRHDPIVDRATLMEKCDSDEQLIFEEWRVSTDHQLYRKNGLE